MNKDNNAFHSQWKEKLHETILEIAKRTPRFLFRVWHETLGGQKGLNASHAITPLAFRKGENPSTIHDVGAIELGDCIDNHLPRSQRRGVRDVLLILDTILLNRAFDVCRQGSPNPRSECISQYD